VAGGDYNLGTAHGTIELNAASLGRASSALDHVANKMLIVGGVAAVGLGYAVKAAGDFEQQMSRFQAVSDSSVGEMDKIRKKALQLGQDSAYGATEVIQAFAELGYAGVSTKEILNGMGDAVVYLAAAAEIPLKDASTALVNTMRQFNLPASQAVETVNELARAANASTVDMADLITSLRYAGPLAAALNIPLNDVAETLAILGNNGIRGSTAGTSLRGILIALTPTSLKAEAAMEKLGLITNQAGQQFVDASGNVLSLQQATDLAAATFKHKTSPSAQTLASDFKKLGLTAQAGSNIFFDANGKLKSMAEVAQILQDHTAGLTDEQKKQAFTTIFQRRAMASALVLAKGGSKAFDDLSHSQQYNTTAQELMNKKLDNMKGSLKILGASLETFAITIGSQLTPILKTGADLLRDFTNWLIRLSPETKKWIVIAVGGVAGLLLFAGALLKIGKGVVGMYKALKDLGTGIKLVGTLLKTAIEANPWILALIGIAAAIIYLYNNSKKFKQFVDDFVYELGKFEAAFVGWISDTFGSDEAKKFLNDFLTTLGGFEIGFINWIGDTFGSQYAKDKLHEFLDTLGGVEVGIANFLLNTFGGNDAKTFLHDFLYTIGEIEVKFADFMLKTFGSHTAKTFLHDFLYELGKIEVGLVQLGAAFVGFVAHQISDFLSGLWDIITTFVKLDVEIIKAGFEWMQKLAQGIVQGWQLIITFFSNLPSNVLKWFATGATWLLQAGIDLLTGLWNGLQQVFKDMPGWGVAIFFNVLSAIGDTTKWLLNKGKDILTGMWKGIKGATGWLVDKIKDWVGGIIDDVLGFFGIHSPSTVFAEIGGYLVTGLVKGIQDNAHLADAAYQSLMPNNLTPSLALAVTGGTGPGSGRPALAKAQGAGAVGTARRPSGNTDTLLAKLVDKVDNMAKPLVGNLNVLPGRTDANAAGFEAVRQLKAARFRTGK
jgi:TP901 family phage tail tape measure protein